MNPRAKLALGGGLAAMLVVAALLSWVWTPGEATRMSLGLRLRSPLEAGLLGTDQFGRDVLSRLMTGAWNSLAIAGTATAIGGGLGTLAGLAAAAMRGIVDSLLMRGCDVLFAFPTVISAIMFGALLGPGAGAAVVAIALFTVPVFARMVRAAALQVWSRPYALAARALGKGTTRITVDHVVPNVAGTIIVQVSIQLGLAILTEAGLSFLGLGIAPPTPTWGRMLAESQTFLGQAPFLAIAPGCAIALAVLGFTLIGDALQELGQPRRRR